PCVRRSPAGTGAVVRRWNASRPAELPAQGPPRACWAGAAGRSMVQLRTASAAGAAAAGGRGSEKVGGGGTGGRAGGSGTSDVADGVPSLWGALSAGAPGGLIGSDSIR